MLRFLMTNLLAFLIALVCSLFALVVYKVGHAAPSRADIEQARSATTSALQEADGKQQSVQIRRAAQDETRKALEKTGATAKTMRESNRVITPQITDELMEKTRRDVSDLLARVRNNPDLLNDSLIRQTKKDSAPLIMISFSMPAESIRGLFREAALAGATVILRGMVDNSMKVTATHLMTLMGVDPLDSEQQMRKQVAAASPPAFAIDPTLFQRFKIDKVPTFVVPLAALGPCSDEKCPVPPYVKVAGDVSLAYALRTIRRRTTDSELHRRLSGWLDRLEESGP